MRRASPISNISSSPTQQRVIQLKQGTVAANGNCTITFDSPPQGQTLTGTLTITNSPGGVVWNVALGGQVITTMIGTTPLDNIQMLASNELLTLSATNLIPGTIVNASYIAVGDTSSSVPLVAPTAVVQQSLTGDLSTPVLNGQTIFIGPGQGTIVFTPPTYGKEITLVVKVVSVSGATSLDAQVMGNTTGVFYLDELNVSANGALGPFFFTIAPEFDTSYTLILSANTPGVTVVTEVFLSASNGGPGVQIEDQPVLVISSAGEYAEQGFNVAWNTTVSTPITPAPPAGLLTRVRNPWLLGNAGIYQIVGATTGSVFQFYNFSGVVSGSLYWTLTVAEGLNVVTASAVNARISGSYAFVNEAEIP